MYIPFADEQQLRFDTPTTSPEREEDRKHALRACSEAVYRKAAVRGRAGLAVSGDGADTVSRSARGAGIRSSVEEAGL